MEDTILVGHTTPETAYVVEDYPYGFRLRCKIRYWLEYKANHGYRLMSQTTNPKVRKDLFPGDVWNKPKGSTYSALGVMLLKPENDKGIREITWTGLNQYTVAENLESFVQKYDEALQSPEAQRVIANYRLAIQRYQDRKAGEALRKAQELSATPTA